MNKETSIDKTVSSIALLCVGICLVVWADKVTDWISILFGTILLVHAIIKFITFIKITPEKRTTLSLFYIILAACAGILLVSRADFIKEAISFIIGIYIILTCSVQLLSISTMRRKTGLAIGSYLWPAIGIIIGLLCISGQFIVPNELARLTGIALIVYAVVYLAGFAVFKKEVKKSTSRQEHAQIKEANIVREAKEAEIVKPKNSRPHKHSKKSKK
ncbi:DUF308 domain-containing protein [Candidatus Saccharibacteria bacterium]|nr:DUF308 domain-containing protein [Candidatus Saccharibacteria bacterium]